MNIAVVGGGVYGIHSAIKLSEQGEDVTIFEKNDKLMMEASKANQWRLHKGFHYPRSKETSVTCRNTQEDFREIYSEAIVTKDNHYYCIASENTKTSPEEFLSHANDLGLGYEEVDLGNLDIVKNEKVDLCLRVNEDRIDPTKLRDIILDRLRDNNVNVEVNHRIDSLKELGKFDYIVVATYANSNWLFDEESSLKRDYKFELVEKPVVSLPPQFEDKSLVIMDGPFMCFDPFEKGDRFLLGNVVHAIHETQQGKVPDFDSKYDGLLNEGVIENPDITKIEKFKSHGSNFIPGLAKAEHKGSMFTIRTTLPNRESTDARPTLVEKEGNVFRIFSGKLSACVDAGERIVDQIAEE